MEDAMKKKIASLLLCATTAAMVLSGCGSSGSQDASQTGETEATTSAQTEKGSESGEATDKAAQAIADRKAEAEKTDKRMQQGKYDLEDFLSTMKQIKKLGPLENLIKMYLIKYVIIFY